MTTAHPFLKWAGGKTKLLHEILPRLPKKIRTYYEPFLGGGAVFFALAAEGRFKDAFLSDANSELILTYSAVATAPVQVIQHLYGYSLNHSEKLFYDTRAFDHTKLDRFGLAARMIYLNRTCFNGLYRVNKKGLFNVPFGRYSNPKICDETNIRAVSRALYDDGEFCAGLACLDFEEAVGTARQGDAVYFDPPYVPLSATANFTAYAKEGFGPAEQERLRDCFAALDKRGVHVLLSNSDTPLVRKLYKGFKISEVQAPRRVNSNSAKRGNVTELLISGKINS